MGMAIDADALGMGGAGPVAPWNGCKARVRVPPRACLASLRTSRSKIPLATLGNSFVRGDPKNVSGPMADAAWLGRRLAR
eukprot:366226-Chlamydomonas_euryale.AAC.1